MEIPPELRRLPPGRTLAWIAGHFGTGASVTAVRRLPNAWAAAMHAVDVVDGIGDRHELVVRRWARTDLPPDSGVVENEATVLTLLASAALSVPRFVAADPTARHADVPALVMTRLPGRDELAPHDMDGYLDGLVETLHELHAVPVAPGSLHDYRPWGLESLSEPPPWTQCPAVWRRGFELARRPVPDFRRGLCHRDFHPGNVLWRRGRVTGVVDWTDACIGPAAADIAHCRLNLALLFGPDVADAFTARYEASARHGALDDLAWFDLVDVLGWGTPDAWRWNDAGRTDITTVGVARAFDDFLSAAIDRLS